MKKGGGGGGVKGDLGHMKKGGGGLRSSRQIRTFIVLLHGMCFGFIMS